VADVIRPTNVGLVGKNNVGLVGKNEVESFRSSQRQTRAPYWGRTPPAAASRARGTSWPHHWDWWKSDLLPRLRPGAAIILIMTRWHEDDLASRLLAEADPTRGLDCGYDRGNT